MTVAQRGPCDFSRLSGMGEQSMTARDLTADMIAVAEAKAPQLAADMTQPADIGQPYDVRLEDLLQGQQGILDLVLGGASLPDVIARVVSVVEAAFAPASAVISLFQRGGR